MFKLESIRYVTLNRITLVYNDTVDKDAAANTDPNNYIVTGAQFVGNIVIFGSTISLDLNLAFPGKLFDIQTDNIVSAAGETVDTNFNRKSFYYGIGSIEPMVVSEGALGRAYIISDSALVGKVTV